MGLGLGTRLGEYKDPETRMPRTRRPRSDGGASSRWNGFSLYLDGVDEVDFTNISVPQFGDPSKVTISMIIRPRAVTETQNIFSIASGDEMYGIHQHDSKIGVWCTSDAGSTITATTTTSSVSNDTWYHIVGLLNTVGTDTSVFYLNGVAQSGSYAGGASWATGTYAGGYNLGHRTKYEDGAGSITTNTDYWYGYASQIAVWEGHLTTNQISGLYFGGKPRSPLNVEKGGPERWPGGSGTHLTYHWPILAVGGSANYPSLGVGLTNMCIHNDESTPSIWQGGIDPSGGFALSGDKIPGGMMTSFNHEGADWANWQMGYFPT